MERRDFIQATSTLLTAFTLPISSSEQEKKIDRHASPITHKLFIYGGQFNEAFTKYTIELTGKKNPKVCFLPTAWGDSHSLIAYWMSTVQHLDLKPLIQRTFITTEGQTEPFENMLLNVDAIVVGGGNTLNMLAVWKAQGMDLILRKAYESGIVIAGGSAGSLCWFENGITDSRPVKLTKLEGLGWIKGSHCPHYDSEKKRKPLYHEMILKGEISPGYACDDLAGVYFENGKFKRAVSARANSKSYYIDVIDGKIMEKELGTEVLTE